MSWCRRPGRRLTQFGRWDTCTSAARSPTPVASTERGFRSDVRPCPAEAGADVSVLSRDMLDVPGSASRLTALVGLSALWRLRGVAEREAGIGPGGVVTRRAAVPGGVGHAGPRRATDPSRPPASAHVAVSGCCQSRRQIPEPAAVHRTSQVRETWTVTSADLRPACSGPGQRPSDLRRHQSMGPDGHRCYGHAVACSGQRELNAWVKLFEYKAGKSSWSRRSPSGSST
ncbi:hypothetical protein FDG2_2040 [Candidatus Protofrankia californiensis]|uniref:Uncharacterized protein n=1 Tax=Candidatus Protofrankia californiensis TaxID=1839754 RepID=A0A1C3NWU9_9ACTN|nr:hypothetical protein FDG2_2040 [Candidatus Protofrankia californiensis]